MIISRPTLFGLFLVSAAALGAVLAGPGTGLANSAQLVENTREICTRATQRTEQARRLPAHLLGAIALAESGRWDSQRQASFAWPWTVTAEGRGRYFPSRAAAIAEVRRLRARGVRNIDVGCMQINLLHHPDAFPSLRRAFDPAANTAYAADFLVDLRDRTGSWIEAAGAYHSRTPKFNTTYKAKVSRLWAGLKRTRVAALPEAKPEGLKEPAEKRPRFVIPPLDRERTARLNARLRESRGAAARKTQPTATQSTLSHLDRWRRTRIGKLDRQHRRIVSQADRMIARHQRGLRDAKSSANFAAKRRAQIRSWRRLSPVVRPADEQPPS